jgi:hypothetical protein
MGSLTDGRGTMMTRVFATGRAIVPTPLALAAALTMVLGLGACGSFQSDSEQGFIDQAGWQHQQVTRDVTAILQGMDQARAQQERVAGQSP